MTPKEKAYELYERFATSIRLNEYNITNECEKEAKQCAIIAVDRELQTVTILYHLCNFDNPIKSVLADTISEIKEVKEEIEKL